MKRSIPILVAAIAVLGAYGLWQSLGSGTTGERVETLDPAKVILIRTEGGHLQVGEIRKVEEFGWQTGWSCPIVDCSILPKTVSRVQIAAHYTYRIPLASEWRLESLGDHYRLTVPPVELQVPVGIDTSQLKLSTPEQSLISPPVAANREMLLRQLGPELAQRGASAAYMTMQQPMAERTVTEFAHKWMRRDGRKIDKPIKVDFRRVNPA